MLTWVSPFATVFFNNSAISPFISLIVLLPVLIPLIISFNWEVYWGKALTNSVKISTLPLISTKAFIIFSVPELILFLTSANKLLFSVIASRIFESILAFPPQRSRISFAVAPFSISRSRIFCRIALVTSWPCNKASIASSKLLFWVIVIFTFWLISVLPPKSSPEQLVKPIAINTAAALCATLEVTAATPASAAA